MIYTGALNPMTMETSARKAYECFRGQRRRTRNSKEKSYKHYGAKGIQVLYQPREFIGWYVAELQQRDWKDPVVGRVDHDRHYEFGNIRMEERVDSTRERCERVGMGEKPVVCFDYVTLEPLMIFPNSHIASDVSAVRQGHITEHCQGKRKRSGVGFTFRYHGGNYA